MGVGRNGGYLDQHFIEEHGRKRPEITRLTGPRSHLSQ